MMLCPSANEAIATARMVWDLEAGIVTWPESLDFRAFMYTTYFCLNSVFIPYYSGTCRQPCRGRIPRKDK